MPVVPVRQRSRGEVNQAFRTKYPKKQQKDESLTKREVRQLHKLWKKKAKRPAPYAGSNPLISDTAKVWQLTYKDTASLYWWVGTHVDRPYRSYVLTKLLRRKYNAQEK